MQIISRDFHEMREVFNSTIHGKLQISYNSDERITLRLIDENDDKKDTLIILDKNETGKLMHFIKYKVTW
ncbi:hypothetical protein BVF91_09640 [Thermoanaerobacterium sp. PSU-2]|uniref:hypothetical protein n=1 Tax=Thermoanaerobacterium sp. PSU-2 TaxID=1930849 RepID=UPI000A168146|nr:hypothetical protein [Thermoanaerobacterium sp. PSU-2]ORX22732.1 hypothetical protein BVF91_09640 [Thermoanaerobacterium sp. PSU-2]